MPKQLKFRAKTFDLMNNVAYLQKHVFLFYWRNIGAGSTKEVQAKADSLNALQLDKDLSNLVHNRKY